jgi:hypothetical protein
VFDQVMRAQFGGEGYYTVTIQFWSICESADIGSAF